MYKSEFEMAVLRTKNFNLKCPKIEYSKELLLTPEKMHSFLSTLRKSFGDIGIDDVVAQCLSIHHRLSDVIADFFNTRCYFTIGHVETSAQLMFHQSEDDLRGILEKGINGSSVNIHAWLTLPTMEIMDFSLPTTYAVLNKMEEEAGGLIATHADNLTGGMKYHPMLVGEDFLRKSGGLIEFGI